MSLEYQAWHKQFTKKGLLCLCFRGLLSMGWLHCFWTVVRPNMMVQKVCRAKQPTSWHTGWRQGTSLQGTLPVAYFLQPGLMSCTSHHLPVMSSWCDPPGLHLWIRLESSGAITSLKSISWLPVCEPMRDIQIRAIQDGSGGVLMWIRRN